MASIEKRETSNGTRYRVKVRLKGYPVQTATFERLTDARKWANQTESAIQEGRHFKTSEAKKHTLADMVERYVENVLTTKPKSFKKQKMQLDWWNQQLGQYRLADISSSLIAEYRDKLLNSTKSNGDKYSPTTVVRYMAALSHAFTIAVSEWGWVEDNPMRKVRKPTEPRGRVRFLDDDERTALLDACKNSGNKFLYPVVVLALSTGMRQGEIMNLCWQDINLEQEYIILHETKNGEIRRVALTGYALKCLKELKKTRRIGTDLVFPQDKKNRPIYLRKPWVNALEKAGIEDFRFHDLRHSAASYLAMNGATIAEIAEVLGHKTLSMVKRYSHLSEAHTKNVVASMNQKMFG